ncbi:DUF362 domain-containing protein [bacterium]|nr:DUF362 domain-containing protein [bacterium]
MSQVSLVTAPSEPLDALVAAVDRALALIGQDHCVRTGDRVLLKPNLHGGQGYTSARTIEALCRWSLDQGAAQVTIGDGAYWGMTDGTEYFEQTGMADVARRTGARLVFFHSGPYRLLQPHHDALPETIGVSEHLYEADAVINVPIPKTHFNALITITLKNLKGCLRPVDKKRFHEMDLHAALAAMNTVIAPLVTVNVLDGTIGYEGMGPGNADPFPWGLLAASTDPVALDATACRLMGIDPVQVRVVRESARLGVGVADEAAIELLGESPEAYRRRFVRPHEALARAFPGLRILSEKACSVCMESLFQGLQSAKEQWCEGKALTVLIGAGPASEADLLIGRCACRGEAGKRAILGCPPPSGEICDAIVNGIRE